MRRRNLAGLALAGLLACGLALMLALVPQPAQAADDGRFEVAQLFEDPPFILRLFGARKREPKPDPGARIIRVPEELGRRARSKPSTPRRAKPVVPAVVANPKAEDAKRVLVIGDRLADGLARGLDVAFADTPGLIIENGSVSPSGLTGGAGIAWGDAVLTRFAAPDPPDALVVMLGLDDRAPLSFGTATAEFRTLSWEAAYRARVQALITAARGRDMPVYWVGLVPMADFDLTTDMAYIDDLFRQVASESFGVYIDVWSAFADETGVFAASGPDVAGQVRQLRLKDGIGFTKSGSRKLAFYVEQALRAWIDKGAPGLVLPQSTLEDGLVVSLSDPQAGLDEDLAIPAAAPAPKPGTPLYDLVVLGKPMEARPGRVDDMMVR